MLKRASSQLIAQLNSSDGTWTAKDGSEVATFQWFEKVFENVLANILQLIGIAAFIMLIVGGIRMISSAGNPEGIEAGKKTLSNAILGLVLAALAWFIISLIEEITGTNLLGTFRVIIP